MNKNMLGRDAHSMGILPEAGMRISHGKTSKQF